MFSLIIYYTVYLCFWYYRSLSQVCPESIAGYFEDNATRITLPQLLYAKDELADQAREAPIWLLTLYTPEVPATKG